MDMSHQHKPCMSFYQEEKGIKPETVLMLLLQEGVMEFVNSIAEIVHQEVALHDGSPNNNIGDAFLLVWKLPPGFEPSLVHCQTLHYLLRQQHGI